MKVFKCFNYRVVKKPGIVEKPGTWQFRQKKSEKTSNLRNYKKLEFKTKITKMLKF